MKVRIKKAAPTGNSQEATTAAANAPKERMPGSISKKR